MKRTYAEVMLCRNTESAIQSDDLRYCAQMRLMLAIVGRRITLRAGSWLHPKTPIIVITTLMSFLNMQGDRLEGNSSPSEKCLTNYF